MSRPLEVLEPGVPPIVTRQPEVGWQSIDGHAWIMGAPVAGETGASLWCVHLDARDPGRQCTATPRGLGHHKVVAAAPLTLEPSLACEICGWHGFVRNGHWTPAAPHPVKA